MADLKLTLACGPYDRTEALERKLVRPDGIDLEVVTIQSPRTLFDRFIYDGEFDVAEYGISTLIEDIAAGDDRFVGLPVFPSKAFRHGFIFVNRGSGIDTPGDLEGKTIGTPLWVQTAAIWIRGHLQHDYGVDLGSVRWVQGAVEQAGAHGNPPLPTPLTPIHIVKAPPDRSLNDMLATGEIDALIGSRAPEAMGRDPAVGRLFPDYRAVERAYFQKTGIHPIMHCVAIRRSVYEANPWIARSLYDTFGAAKDWALDLMRFSGAQRYMLPWLFPDLDEIDALFGGDPWPYGVEANRPTLTALTRYMAEQGMIAREVRIEELFVPLDA